MSPWGARIAGMGLVVALAACASSPSASTAKEQQHAKAAARATEYCKKKGLVMRVSNVQTPTRAGQAPSELQFHCVKAK